jgi:hypothetical protein
MNSARYKSLTIADGNRKTRKTQGVTLRGQIILGRMQVTLGFISIFEQQIRSCEDIGFNHHFDTMMSYFKSSSQIDMQGCCARTVRVFDIFAHTDTHLFIQVYDSVSIPPGHLFFFLEP